MLRQVLMDVACGRARTDELFKRQVLDQMAQPTFRAFLGDSVLDPDSPDATPQAVLEMDPAALEAIVDPWGRINRSADARRPPHVAVFRGGSGFRGSAKVLKACSDVFQDVVLSATDDGERHTQPVHVFSRYFWGEDGITGIPDIGKSLLDLADDEGMAALGGYSYSVDLASKQGVRPYEAYSEDPQRYADALELFRSWIIPSLSEQPAQVAEESMLNGLLARVEVWKKRGFAAFIRKYWQVATTDTTILAALAEYQPKMVQMAELFNRLAQKERRPHKRAILERIAAEYGRESKKPPILDITRIPLIEMALIGARLVEQEKGTPVEAAWQNAIDNAALLLGVTRGRVYRATDRAAHMTTLLPDGTILPDENSVNEVPRTHREATNPVFHIFPRPLSLDEIQLAYDPPPGRTAGDVLADLQDKMRETLPRANPRALQAVREASAVILSWGSQYSNVAPSLVPAAMREAVRNRQGPAIMLANSVPEVGNTATYHNAPSSWSRASCETMWDFVHTMTRLLGERQDMAALTGVRGIDYVIGGAPNAGTKDIELLPLEAERIEGDFGTCVLRLRSLLCPTLDDKRVPVRADPTGAMGAVLSLIQLWDLGYRISARDHRVVPRIGLRQGER